MRTEVEVRDEDMAEIKRLRAQLDNSLGRNLCPDHRDKQAGKSCLACEIERLRALNAELTQWLLVVLDQVDYTAGACGLTEMVGTCLDSSVIAQARAALAKATQS